MVSDAALPVRSAEREPSRTRHSRRHREKRRFPSGAPRSSGVGKADGAAGLADEREFYPCPRGALKSSPTIGCRAERWTRIWCVRPSREELRSVISETRRVSCVTACFPRRTSSSARRQVAPRLLDPAAPAADPYESAVCLERRRTGSARQRAMGCCASPGARLPRFRRRAGERAGAFDRPALRRPRAAARPLLPRICLPGSTLPSRRPAVCSTRGLPRFRAGPQTPIRNGG